ncbi:MAG: putative serine/threonine protein kinase [Streblomastix strix]|uniref:Putative serine/threonine protein kinase n=1 Tax=Streblomastix strix TaxID=222440 RepID=A0A5J4WHI5_9EUKA|nr:MAG: putative serine/threonine protein kinase [Streblomastix strix]
MNYEYYIRQAEHIPIRPLGKGSFGCVYLTYSIYHGFVATKIIQKDKYDEKELDAAIQLQNKERQCQFVTRYIFCNIGEPNPILGMEYSNLNTLNVIAKYSQIPLPSYTFRALMKQTFEGMRYFHATGMVHRDIKCDNILMHNPTGSNRVNVKISDFGFAKKVDLINEQTYLAGTIPFMSPEQFHEQPIITQKVDIYALGITFYRLLTHKYPVNCDTFKEQGKRMIQLKSIDKPPEIVDNLLWNLFSQLLEFDPNKRITAVEALKHAYFTSSEAIADISPEQNELASLAAVDELEGNLTITQFDKDPSFIVAKSVINKEIGFILELITSSA